MCERIDPNYPEGRCKCHANHRGEACEACADGYVRHPLGSTAALGFHCVICDFSSNSTYAADCASYQDGLPPILLGVLIPLAVFLVLGLGMYWRHLRYRRVAAAVEESTVTRIREAVMMMQRLGFPFCVVRFSTFKQMGRFLKHEEARNNGQLVMLDTWAEAVAFGRDHPIVFNSHQWLGWAEPDPVNIHYPVMVTAGEALCAQRGIAESDLFMWVDVLSIPQANLSSKLTAISTIAVYACCCEFFVACVPTTTHADSRCTCDAESYLRRGWCRLEQWAFMSVHGIRNMFMAGETSRKKATLAGAITLQLGFKRSIRRVAQSVVENNNVAVLTKLEHRPHWLSQSIKVMDGDFTVPADKAQLVDVVLGLYAFTVVTGRDEGGLQHLIDQMKESVFPQKLFGNLVSRLEIELERSRTDFSRSINVFSGRKQMESIFQRSDFQAMLTAKEAFLLVQGEKLAPDIKSTLSRRQSTAASVARRSPRDDRSTADEGEERKSFEQREERAAVHVQSLQRGRKVRSRFGFGEGRKVRVIG